MLERYVNLTNEELFQEMDASAGTPRSAPCLPSDSGKSPGGQPVKASSTVDQIQDRRIATIRYDRPFPSVNFPLSGMGACSSANYPESPVSISHPQAAQKIYSAGVRRYARVWPLKLP